MIYYFDPGVHEINSKTKMLTQSRILTW